MKRDYKKDYARRKLREMSLTFAIPRKLGCKFRTKLAKKGKKLTDFFREAIEEYLND